MLTYQVLTVFGFCIAASFLGLALGRLSARLLRFEEDDVPFVAQMGAYLSGAFSFIGLSLFMAEMTNDWSYVRDWSELLLACLVAQLFAFLLPGALAVYALWNRIENLIVTRVDRWFV